VHERDRTRQIVDGALSQPFQGSFRREHEFDAVDDARLAVSIGGEDGEAPFLGEIE